MRNSLLVQTSVALVVLIMAVPGDAASLWASGCETLYDRAAPTCKAKLSCDDQTKAIAAAERAFAACEAGQKLSETEVSDVLNQFTNERYFRCCIGNGQLLRSGLKTLD